MENNNSVNVGKEHSSGQAAESLVSQEQGVQPTPQPTREEWLRDLKPGDEVARQMSGGWYGYLHVDFATVKRRTATYIFIGSEQNAAWEQKFRARDGREPGHGMYMLRASTPELKDQLDQQTRRQQALKRIDSVKWPSLSLDVLESVVALTAKPDSSGDRGDNNREPE